MTEMTEAKEYITVRIDSEMKDLLVKASQEEHRSLSNLCRLLLEYAAEHYRQAGSLHDLLNSQKELTFDRS